MVSVMVEIPLSLTSSFSEAGFMLVPAATAVAHKFGAATLEAAVAGHRLPLMVLVSQVT